MLHPWAQPAHAPAMFGVVQPQTFQIRVASTLQAASLRRHNSGIPILNLAYQDTSVRMIHGRFMDYGMRIGPLGT